MIQICQKIQGKERKEKRRDHEMTRDEREEKAYLLISDLITCGCCSFDFNLYSQPVPSSPWTREAKTISSSGGAMALANTIMAPSLTMGYSWIWEAQNWQSRLAALFRYWCQIPINCKRNFSRQVGDR